MTVANRPDLKPMGPILSTGPHEVGGGLWQTTYLAEVDGRLEVVGVDLRAGVDASLNVDAVPSVTWLAPKGRTRALKTADVRSLRLPAMKAAELDRWISGGQRLLDRLERDPFGMRTDKASAQLVALLRRHLPIAARSAGAEGRVRLDADHFAEVALVYSSAWQRGEDPTMAVRTRWDLSQRTAARWVERARNEHGFLGATSRFQADGRLTTKAARRLAAQTKEAVGGAR